MKRGRALLLFVLVPFRPQGAHLCLEPQACHGLERWLDSFDTITLAAAAQPPSACRHRSAEAPWVPVDELPFRARLILEPFPWAYQTLEFLQQRRACRPRIRRLIDSNSYLSFAMTGWTGDWGRVAASEAMKLGAPYTVHLEWVESSVGWVTSQTAKQKARFLADYVPRVLSDRKVLANAAVVLGQGADTVEAYRRYNPNTVEIVNVHTRSRDLPTEESIARKAEHAEQSEPLRVVYAGRLSPEKAPLDWVRAIHRAVSRGAEVSAEWYGSGALEADTKELAHSLGLENVIQFMGYVEDRARMLSRIHAGHVLLFTHVSREPSRILVEALNMGTPIVGYESLRAKALVDENGGGRFSPMRQPGNLGDLLHELARDREMLADLIRRSGRDGRRYTAEAAFAERARLIIQATDAARGRPGAADAGAQRGPGDL